MRRYNIRFALCALALSDILALCTAAFLAYMLRSAFASDLRLEIYLKLMPLAALFLSLYAALGLYPGFTLSGPERLRRLSAATSLGLLFFGAFTFLGRGNQDFSRIFLLLFWLLALFCVPLARCLTRQIFGPCKWWGLPCVFFGHPAALAECRARLEQERGAEFSFLAGFTLPAPAAGTEECAAPAAGMEEFAALAAGPVELRRQLRAYKNACPDFMAVILSDRLTEAESIGLLRKVGLYARQILFLPPDNQDLRAVMTTADFCGRSGFSLRQNLLDQRRLRLKRLLDFFAALLLTACLLPLLALIYVVVRLDSPGPGFYRHKRLGRNGLEIRLWKFRTMRIDAEARLKALLREDKALHREWKAEHKLRLDPRITRVGDFLRRFSLDELPQLFNVLLGNMSLVGPRPIVAREIPKYGAAYSAYMRVRPGITGLWQVSGRNNTGYAARVALDEYYIANWSAWLDIYILARTLPAVLQRRGAY